MITFFTLRALSQLPHLDSRIFQQKEGGVRPVKVIKLNHCSVRSSVKAYFGWFGVSGQLQEVCLNIITIAATTCFSQFIQTATNYYLLNGQHTDIRCMPVH